MLKYVHQLCFRLNTITATVVKTYVQCTKPARSTFQQQCLFLHFKIQHREIANAVSNLQVFHDTKRVNMLESNANFVQLHFQKTGIFMC